MTTSRPIAFMEWFTRWLLAFHAGYWVVRLFRQRRVAPCEVAATISFVCLAALVNPLLETMVRAAKSERADRLWGIASLVLLVATLLALAAAFVLRAFGL